MFLNVFSCTNWFMPQKESKANSPTILAAFHGGQSDERTLESMAELNKIFKRAEKDKRKRTLFIEGDKPTIARLSSGFFAALEPFFFAISEAKRIGWNVVPLGQPVPKIVESLPLVSQRYVYISLQERY